MYGRFGVWKVRCMEVGCMGGSAYRRFVYGRSGVWEVGCVECQDMISTSAFNLI